MAAVRESGMQDRTTFFIVADHGFKGYTKEIRPGIALAAAGLAGKVYVLAEGGSALVYIDKSQEAELLPKTVQALTGIEGIDRVVAQDGFAAMGLPLPVKDPQMGQLFLTAKTAEVPQTRGSHGYVASDPEMDALFIASGYGVRPGVHLDKIANTDVAPTIAKLLGVSLRTAKGKVLAME